MKILLFMLCVFITITLAQEQDQTLENNNSSTIDYTKFFDADEEKVGKNNKEYFEEIFTSNQNSKLIYTNQTYIPKKIFKNQRFYIELSATVVTDNFDSITTRFLNMKNLHLLNPDSKWVLDKDNIFKNKFYFKVENQDFVMPIFQVALEKNAQIIDSSKFEVPNIEFVSIAKEDKEFANLVADKIELKSTKAKQYNNKQLLVIIELDGVNSNLEDFHIKELSLDQGVLSFDDKGSIQKVYYYFIAPIYQKSVRFKYFNNKQNQFLEINVPISLEEDLVSTQTDLNPYDNSFVLYKKIALGVLAILLLLIYYFKRKIFILIVFLIVLIYLIVLLLPNKVAILKEKSDIRIIPTNNSTVFYKPTRALKVEILDKKGEFLKVIFKNRDTKRDNIGWIKESEIVKN